MFHDLFNVTTYTRKVETYYNTAERLPQLFIIVFFTLSLVLIQLYTLPYFKLLSMPNPI